MLNNKLSDQNSYYPFGMLMPERQYASANSGYRFGFNGQEHDDDVKGIGNEINFKFRAYDPRLGRFLSIDPLAAMYAYNSPYAFAENKLGLGKELEGLELIFLGQGATWTVPEAYMRLATESDVGIPRTVPVPPIGIIQESIPTGNPTAPPPTISIPEAFKNPDVTMPNDATQAKPTFEARKKQTEAEIDEANEKKKIEAMEKKAANAGQTKANTKNQQKETGQNLEEIKRAQDKARKASQGNKIQDTKKSEQNDKKEIEREAQESLDKKAN